MSTAFIISQLFEEGPSRYHSILSTVPKEGSVYSLQQMLLSMMSADDAGSVNILPVERNWEISSPDSRDGYIVMKPDEGEFIIGYDRYIRALKLANKIFLKVTAIIIASLAKDKDARVFTTEEIDVEMPLKKRKELLFVNIAYGQIKYDYNHMLPVYGISL